MKKIHPNHAAHLPITESRNVELILVRGGRRAYLWVGNTESRCIGIVSGPVALRKLAQAILKEIPIK